MGVKLNSGQLEITEVELVLHRRGKQPVKWPLRYHFGFTGWCCVSNADVDVDSRLRLVWLFFIGEAINWLW